jgi:hypothetical protein
LKKKKRNAICIHYQKKMAIEEAEMKKTLKPLQRSKISEVGCIN